ncbi:hypothetical protein N9878_01120 [bacterium]|nr:hypothetical protein [bacterium]
MLKKTKHTSFTVLNAVVALCKIQKQRERDLTNHLACKFSADEVVQSIRTACDIGAIRKIGMQKKRSSEPVRYVAV